MKTEIKVCRTEELVEHIEVRMEDGTVWLSQNQMATLFDQTKQNISLHINNCFRENELDREATVKQSLTVHASHSVKSAILFKKENSTALGPLSSIFHITKRPCPSPSA